MYVALSLSLLLSTIAGPCDLSAPETDPSLSQLWTMAEENSLAIRALDVEEEARTLNYESEQLQRRPDFSVQSQADIGRRARPGEERGMGFSARGDTLALGALPIFDLGFSARRQAAQESIEEVLTQRASLRDQERRQIASLYVELLGAIEDVALQNDYKENVDALAEIIELRAEAGVEASGTIPRVARLRSDARRAADDAATRLQEALDELARASRTCIHLTQAPDLAELEDFLAISAQDSPSEPPILEELHQRARSLEAQAQAMLTQGIFTSQAIGAAGIYYSLAYEDFVEPELYLGFIATWRPDLFGQRRLQAEGLELLANNARQEALRLGEDLSETAAQLRQQVERIDTQIADATEARELYLEDRQSAQTRFRQGVGPWIDLVNATDALRLLEEEILILRKRRLHTTLALAAATGALSDFQANP